MAASGKATQPTAKDTSLGERRGPGVLGPAGEAVLVEQDQDIGRGHDQGGGEGFPEAVDAEVEPAERRACRRAPGATPPGRSGRSRARSASAGQELPHEALVDPGQALDVGDRHVLVGLVHGGADQAELDHRAVGREEARVGGAARGAERRPQPGLGLDAGRQQLAERARRGDERLGIARARSARTREPAARSARRSQCVEAVAGVAVVEADVEAGAGLAGDDVAGRVADVDRGHLQVRGLEPVGALVERRRDQVAPARRPADGRRCRRAAGRRCGPAGRAR